MLIEWLVDLMRVFIYGSDGTTIRELVADRLFLPRAGDNVHLKELARKNQLPTSESLGPSRLEWLFFYHTRLWKRPRFRLKDLYITMLSLSQDYKTQMGAPRSYSFDSFILACKLIHTHMNSRPIL